MASLADERVFPVQDAVAIRLQLERLVTSDALRSSRRSVAFLRYIVEQTLQGNAEELKERTIGVGVFGKALTYDTNLDHAVRTAATELRKRLSIYYGQEEHRDELRILLVPGSYVPQFRPPETAAPETVSTESVRPLEEITSAPAPTAVSTVETAVQQDPPGRSRRVLGEHPGWWALCAGVILVASVAAGLNVLGREHSTPMQRFWQPLLRSDGPVLIAVGDVPGGPPIPSASTPDSSPPSPKPASPGPISIPFADAITTARVAGVFAEYGRETLIRRETASSFADLRERPVVLIGAFNNGWSLRLTRNLRFSLAMDPSERLIYIRDREHPESRAWRWSIDPHPGEKDRSSPQPLHDYALISRILDSETGHDVVVIGGLYVYGTQAAGDFVSNPQLMELARQIPLEKGQHSLQIVLETQVTEATPGPPRVVAYDVE